MKVLSLLSLLAATFAVSSPVSAASCYQITCTSLAGATNTVRGNVDAKGIIVAAAPSGLSAWVLKVSGGKLSAAQNCFSDQAIADGNTPRNLGSATCRAYGGRAGLDGQTFEQGGWNSFKSCSQAKACR